MFRRSSRHAHYRPTVDFCGDGLVTDFDRDIDCPVDGKLPMGMSCCVLFVQGKVMAVSKPLPLRSPRTTSVILYDLPLVQGRAIQRPFSPCVKRRVTWKWRSNSPGKLASIMIWPLCSDGEGDSRQPDSNSSHCPVRPGVVKLRREVACLLFRGKVRYRDRKEIRLGK